MKKKYLLFHTGKSVLFLFYALVFLMLVFLYAGLTQKVPEGNMLGGALLYLAIVVFYAFRIDRTSRDKRL